MISPFLPTAGLAGGVGPPLAPGAASVPVVDGFDALLGQLSAALLATVADAAPSETSPHASAAPGHDSDVGTHVAAEHAAETAVVDPAVFSFAVPVAPAPSVLEPLAARPTGSHDPEDGDHFAGKVFAAPPHRTTVSAGAGAGVWPAGQRSADTASAASIHEDAAFTHATAADIAEKAAFTHERAVDTFASAMASAPSATHVATSSSTSVPVYAAAASSAPVVDVLAESYAANRSVGPLPFERNAHERPIGRRNVDLILETMSSSSPSPSPSIVPVVSTVDSVATEPAEGTVMLADSAPRALVSRGGARREMAPPSDLARRGARFIGPYERIAGHVTQGQSAIVPDPPSGGTTIGPLPAQPAPVGVTAPVVTSSPAVVDPVPTDATPVPASRPQPAAGAAARGRALDAHTDHLPEQAAPAGLVAAVARSLTASDVSTDANAVGEVANRRAGRLTPTAAARATFGMPLGTAATGDPSITMVDRPAWATAAMAPTWRAGLASTDHGGDAPAGPPPQAPPGQPFAPFATVVRPPVDDLPVGVDTAAVETPALDAGTGESVHGQIVRSLKVQWTGGLSEARVTLRPEFLGEVVATITVEQGVVSATLQADTPEVRRWMEAHTSSLRDALVEHGLKLDRLTVAEPAREPADADRQGRQRGRQPEAPPSRRRRAPDTQEPQFELTA